MASESAASPLNHFESVAEIQQKHREEITAVRAKLTEGQQDDDVIVYRYLRGYKFNVDKAAAALNKTLKWRKEGGLDAIREKAKDIDQKDFPFAAQILRCHPHRIHHREDKKGQPLSLERIGHTNPALLRKLVTLEQLVAYHLYHVENKAHLAVELTKKTGRVMRMCKVLDLDGLSLRLMDPQGLSWLNHIITLSQDHYPEMMGNLYIINAPWMFKMFWNIVKPWLQPATLEKIQIFGTSDYQDKLLEAIGADNLPKWAGGNCECPEGCVVEKGEAFGFTEKTVPRKDQVIEEVEVKEKDIAVAWEFRTDQYDIGFSAYFKTASGNRIQVEESKRYDAHKEHVYGAYEAKEPGVLVLIWDNSYSRWTDKKLFFRVEQSAASSALHEAIEEQHAHSHPHEHHAS